VVQAALLYLRQGGEPFTVSTPPEPAPAIERPRPPRQTAEAVVSAGGDWVSPTELRLRLSIDPAYHINAHDPGGGPGAQLVATRVSVEGAAPDAAVEYPVGEEMAFAFAGAPVRVYGGEATVTIRFAAPVTVDLRLSLTYQACDASACLPPVTKPIEVPAP
jgi:hypothetical protein